MQKIQVTLNEDELRAIETWRKDRNYTSRTVAIRKLLRQELNLGADGKSKSVKPSPAKLP